MSKLCGIYKIENAKDGKVYIGQSVDIEKRWAFHKWELNANRHKNGHLQNAWNAHPDDFTFSVLELCDRDSLDKREIFYISKLNSNDPAFGYNLTSGGEGLRDLPRTEEHRKHMSEALKGRKGPMKGKRFTPEHRAKIAVALKGNKNMGYGKDNPASKPVICLDTGEVFECAAEAGRHYGSKSTTPGVNIRKCCVGERKQSLGHRWAFVK